MTKPFHARPLLDCDAKHRKMVFSLIATHLPNTTIWAYGSRVTFTAHHTSDLDLVAFAAPDQSPQVENLREAFEESDLPFFVDLFVWDKLPEAFHANIKAAYVVLAQGSPSTQSASMGEFPTKYLCEVTSMISGFAFKSKHMGDGASRVVKIKNVVEPHVLVDECDVLDETQYPSEKIAKFKLNEGDVLISMTGYLGRVAMMPSIRGTYFLNQRVAKLVPNKSRDLDFLKFHLQNDAFKDHCEAFTDSATAQPNISVKSMSQFEIEWPSFENRQAIAEVMCSLDDKIDLLKRQNKTLEGMAEALFRQWFIEEAQDDWEYMKLGDFVEITNGLSYKSSDLKESSRAMISLKCFRREGGFTRDGLKEFDGAYKERHIARKGDLFIACTDLTQDAEVVGNPIVLNDTFGYSMLVFSMDTVKVEPIGVFGLQFLYQLMRTRMFKEHCKAYSNGSTVLHLQKSAIPDFEFFVPPVQKSDDFESKCEQFNKRMVLNELQIKSLEQQRNTLLPKLMSGEVRVRMVS